jgi:serine/threonine protein kinase
MTADFAPGSAFGPYVLDAYVGAGSFGQVWKAHDAASGEVVAIKLLATGPAAPSLTGMRAEVELLAAAAVSRSPHIARVLDGGSEPVPHVVMEYVDGTTWRRSSPESSASTHGARSTSAWPSPKRCRR